eukprot:8980814-Pyramimonas_sp.AAC.1
MFLQGCWIGPAQGDGALCAGPPLRAFKFETELGVQDPSGLWGPAGCAADGSADNLAHQWQAELKNGR